MADIAFYRKHFGINSNEELLDSFLRGLKRTNWTADFFVDWAKISAKVCDRDYRNALSLVAGIRLASNLPEELKCLLLTYPRIGEIVADMLAIHEAKTPVILERNQQLQEISIIFRTESFTEDQAETLTLFVEQSGLLRYLSKITSIWDYVFGVEVGTDTNARKNRGGKLGEQALSKFVTAAVGQKNLGHALNAKPSKVLQRREVIQKSAFDRRFDALIHSASKIIAIEVNFYSGGGTKLDSIASDYQTRARDCRQAGLTFAWVTDGQGWNSSKGMLRQAIANIDYIFNFELLERGALAKLCNEVFR